MLKMSGMLLGQIRATETLFALDVGRLAKELSAVSVYRFKKRV